MCKLNKEQETNMYTMYISKALKYFFILLNFILKQLRVSKKSFDDASENCLDPPNCLITPLTSLTKFYTRESGTSLHISSDVPLNSYF